ncbi:30S ribosomal protein S13 [Patescibacteria group bacterium]
MARIAGVNLPKEKRIEAGLTVIFGIGRKKSREILEKIKIDFDKKVGELTEQEIESLRKAVEGFPIEGELKRKVAMDVKRLQEINCYRGYRHRRGLPLRGQRTRYNSRTKKGKRKTVANKKIAVK